MSNLLRSHGIGPILDSTLRDGRYLGNWRPELTRCLVADLAACGVSGIEIGPELGLGDTSSDRFTSRKSIFEDINSAASVKSSSLIGSFFIPGIGVHEDLIQARREGLDFVRIGQNPANWTSAVPFIETAISSGLRVFFNLMKSHLVTPHQFTDIVGQLSELPLDGVYLVDSTGTLTPDDVRRYVMDARKNTSLSIGFHGHDNLGLANANSLMAWTCGAKHVDGTLLGIGRGGGNASTERLFGLRTRLSLESSVDLRSICKIALNLESELKYGDRHLDYLDLVCGILGFHSSWLNLAKEIAGAHAVDCVQLIEAVSTKDRESPSRALFEEVARGLAEDGR